MGVEAAFAAEGYPTTLVPATTDAAITACFSNHVLRVVAFPADHASATRLSLVHDNRMNPISDIFILLASVIGVQNVDNVNHHSDEVG